MKYIQILSRFSGSFWLIRDDVLVATAQLLEARINNVAALPMVPAEPMQEEGDPETQDMSDEGFAVVEVSGMLGKRLSMMEAMCGGCDYNAVVAELEQALALPMCRGVIMRFDSPGGTVVGCREAAARISEICAASMVPVVAYCDTECASAAYWLASSCDAIFATESALVGSTGTKMVVRDQSEANAKAGVKFHVFKSGGMKDVLASYRAPTEDESKALQAMADRIGANFRADVTAHRPQVAATVFADAMFYDAATALPLGLVDKIVPDMRAVVAELTGASLSPLAR